LWESPWTTSDPSGEAGILAPREFSPR
jgi:hypothetical protein